MEFKLETIKKGVTKETSLSPEQLVKMISGDKYKKRVEALREKIALGIDLKGAELEETRKLPVVVIPESTILLSFECKDQKTYNTVKGMAECLPVTWFCFRGCSSRTLKVIVKWTGRNSDKERKTAWSKIAKFYELQLGLSAHAKTNRVEAAFRMTFDPDIFYNENAMTVEVFPADKIAKSKVCRRPTEKTLDDSYRELVGTDDMLKYTESENMARRFHNCYAKVTAQKHDGDDLFIMDLARLCRDNGLPREFCVARTLAFSQFSHLESVVPQIFYNVYREEAVRNRQSTTNYNLQLNRLYDYLDERFRFRRNTVTDNLEYIDNAKKMYDWKEADGNLVASITIDAQRAGIDIFESDVRLYLRSNKVEEYEPLEKYLNDLPQWDGNDHIRQYANRLTTDYLKWQEYFHRWYLAMVAQWIGVHSDFGQSMMILIIGEQGDGKSTFCRRILPEALKMYYTDRIDLTNMREAERFIARFLLINADEYDSLSSRQEAKLKNLLSKTDVNMRKSYSDKILGHKRMASFIGTTNNYTPLTDETGSRRYLCVQCLCPINVTENANAEQMIAQAMAEIRRGERSYFLREEELEIQKHNRSYKIAEALEDAMNAYLSKPKGKDEGEWLSATEIVGQLHLISKAVKTDKGTVSKTGRLMSRLGYEKRRTRYCVQYRVVVNHPKVAENKMVV